jgi:SPW repeat
VTPTYHSNAFLMEFSTKRVLIAGAWLFFSPWIWGGYSIYASWNCWVVGAAIVALAALHLAHPPTMEWGEWINALLACWVFGSPWIFYFQGDLLRLINSFAVAICVLALSLESGLATYRMIRHIPPEPDWR